MLSHKTWHRFVFAAALGAAALMTLGMQEAGGRRPEDPQQGERRRPGGERVGASVEIGMKMMNRAVGTLEGQISDPAKKEENLRLINEVQRGCVTAKGSNLEAALKEHNETVTPDMPVKLRATLIDLNRVLLDVESNLLNDQFDQAKANLEKATGIRDQAHKDFNID